MIPYKSIKSMKEVRKYSQKVPNSDTHRLLTINDRNFIALRGQETVYGTIQINKNDCDEIYRCTHSTHRQMPRKDIGKIPRKAPFFGIKLDGFLKF